MSGSSTENLLKHSHMGESADKIHDKTASSQKKPAQDERSKGILNPGFVGDYKQHQQEDIYGPVEALHSSPNKRATSFQQKPNTFPPTNSRRHSSPEPYDTFDKYGKPRRKHGLSKHRLTSAASEEDLRRKAFINSMKADRRFQSVSHLPSSVQADSEASSDEKQQNNISKAENSSVNVVDKVDDSTVELGDSRSSSDVAPAGGINSSTSSPRQYQDEDPQVLQTNVIALERAQLNQYKKRLTLALSERANLTEQLQFLSTSLSRPNLQLENESAASSPRSTLCGNSPRQALSFVYSPRQALSAGQTPRYPSLCEVEEGRCLPTLPTKKKAVKTEMVPDSQDEEVDTSRLSDTTYLSRIADGNQSNNSRDNLTTKKKVGEKAMTEKAVDHEEMNSSRLTEPTYLSRIVDGNQSNNSRDNLTTKKKVGEKAITEKAVDHEEMNSSRLTEPTYLSRIVDAENQANNSEDDLTPRRKENLSKASEEIWQKYLHSEEMQSSERDNESKGKDKSVKDENNNNRKKPLTVEEFLASENQQDFDENDKEIRRVLENASRHSPELYEPLLRYDIGEEKEKKTSQSEKHNKTPRNTLNLKKDDIEDQRKHYENEDYETLRTLSNSRQSKDGGGNEYEIVSPAEVHKRDHQHPRHYTRLQKQNKRLFNYMTPPGTTNHPQEDTQAIVASRGGSATSAPERAPSNISEKLRYYRGVVDDRKEADHKTQDFADAYANEKDPEKRREIQQQAAAEAAMLRREASALLFEAMNLERLCDPNARVRHIYLQH